MCVSMSVVGNRNMHLVVIENPHDWWNTQMHTYRDTFAMQDTIENTHLDDRPLTFRRVIVPGKSTVNAPKIVSCEWFEIKRENLDVQMVATDDLDKFKSCDRHENVRCKGHLCKSSINGAYMIPNGFANGDELRQSNAFITNKMVVEGRKGPDDMMKFCNERIAGKNGLLRKSCNGSRPTNSCRFVASPPLSSESLSIFGSESWPMGVISVPPVLMRKGLFVHVSADGRCSTKRLREGDKVVLGRCPSQGQDSALPVVVVAGSEDQSSVRVPLEMCSRNNVDFDGDEVWFKVPATKVGMEELDAAWVRVWGSSRVTDVLKHTKSILSGKVSNDSIDPVMYSTMPLEDMESHPGGELYETLMLKPKSWRVMCKVMSSNGYWKTWVDRSEQGIVNTTMGRHGIAGPYGIMRLGMMLGTCVTVRHGLLAIDSEYVPPLPVICADLGMNAVTCSSAMAKLTKIMYQRGIDTAKHGSDMDMIPAMETMAKCVEQCYMIANTGEGVSTVMTTYVNARMLTSTYTKLESLERKIGSPDLIQTAIMIVSMIEEIDNVMLTEQERIAAAVLFSFLSANINAFIDVDMVEVMNALGLDWYTSVTCSDIRWIRDVIRNRQRYPYVRTDCDVGSILGAILLGNMDRINFSNNSMVSGRTVATGTNTSSTRWADEFD
jgi:hypothetical protein